MAAFRLGTIHSFLITEKPLPTIHTVWRGPYKRWVLSTTEFRRMCIHKWSWGARRNCHWPPIGLNPTKAYRIFESQTMEDKKISEPVRHTIQKGGKFEPEKGLTL